MLTILNVLKDGDKTYLNQILANPFMCLQKVITFKGEKWKVVLAVVAKQSKASYCKFK